MSRSSIGKAITTSLYEKFSGIDRKDFMDTKTDRWKIKVSSILSPKLKFQTKILNDLLRTVAQSTIVVGSTKDEDKFKHEFQFGNAVYTMALGGLHSQDKPGLLIASEIGACIRDADVASFYPMVFFLMMFILNILKEILLGLLLDIQKTLVLKQNMLQVKN